MALIEALVPGCDDSETPTRLAFDGHNWTALDKTEGWETTLALMKSFTDHPRPGEHQKAHPLVWRALCGVSSIGGKLTKFPEEKPLPEGAVS